VKKLKDLFLRELADIRRHSQAIRELILNQNNQGKSNEQTNRHGALVGGIILLISHQRVHFVRSDVSKFFHRLTD
jgi:hypothetical protein